MRHYPSSSSLPILSTPPASLLYEEEVAVPARALLPKLLWRVLWGYVLLLLLLVPLGMYNRQLYQQEWELIAYKDNLLNSRADLRVAEAKIRGPERVRAWALERGMVPNAEVDDVHQISYIFQVEPSVAIKDVQVEVINTWR